MQFFVNIFRFAGSILRGLKDSEFRGLLLFVVVILIVGTVFYHGIEQWRWLDAFYFSAISLTTVGYGDLAPATDLGKIFTILYIFSGIGVILGFLNAVARKAAEKSSLESLVDKKKRGRRFF